jgi:hypothetical protein
MQGRQESIRGSTDLPSRIWGKVGHAQNVTGIGSSYRIDTHLCEGTAEHLE